MLKESLREKDYKPTFVQIPLLLLSISSVLFVALFFFAEVVLTIYGQRVMMTLGIDQISIAVFMLIPIYFAPVVYPLAAIFLYFTLITITSKFFCESKIKNTKLKFINKINMPSCTCVEALKPYQLIS